MQNLNIVFRKAENIPAIYFTLAAVIGTGESISGGFHANWELGIRLDNLVTNNFMVTSCVHVDVSSTLLLELSNV
jgi:hypothetical protein